MTPVIEGVEVSPEEGTTTLFGHLVSEMQDDIEVNLYDEPDPDGFIGDLDGTLKFIDNFAESGPLAGYGYYLALKFNADWSKYSSVKVGLDPSAGTGLVEIINDPDKNGVFKLTRDPDEGFTQKLVVETTDATTNEVKDYEYILYTLTTEEPSGIPFEYVELVGDKPSVVEGEEFTYTYGDGVLPTVSTPESQQMILGISKYYSFRNITNVAATGVTGGGEETQLQLTESTGYGDLTYLLPASANTGYQYISVTFNVGEDEIEVQFWADGEGE